LKPARCQKEAIAGGTVLAFSKADPASNELIKAIVADLESGEGRASGPDGIFGKDRYLTHRSEGRTDHPR
jgi:hypothetical protein